MIGPTSSTDGFVPSLASCAMRWHRAKRSVSYVHTHGHDVRRDAALAAGLRAPSRNEPKPLGYKDKNNTSVYPQLSRGRAHAHPPPMVG